ncbi:MAG: DNA repair protein RadC [Bacteroidales bacterium]|nr:DNA repair protein RadC [Bacteroidales bacterium]
MERAGARALSNAELLAILIKDGTRDESAVEIAQKLLAGNGGSLRAIGALSARNLRRIRGIGPAKASLIVAAFELGRRHATEIDSTVRRKITGPADAAPLFLEKMKGLDMEESWALFLNRTGYVTDMRKISSGTRDSTLVDRKALVRMAVDCLASSVIISHNHPSGDPHPGKADIKLTEELKTALDAFEIDLVDHIIVSDQSYFSMNDGGVTRFGKG